MSLIDQAKKAIVTADFRDSWPLDARRILVKAAKTTGDDVPPFARREVTWALKTTRAIEKRLLKDIEKGEASLPVNRRKRELGKVA